MSVILLEIAAILALLCLNGVFSMSEMALMTARRTRLEHRAEDGDAGAGAALALAAHPTSFLSTVQIGITLIGVLAGAFGGAGIAARLAGRLATAPALAPYAEGLALTIVVAAITYGSLIIGELVPKQIALSNPERVAALVARPMIVVARVARPLVHFLSASTNLVTRVLGLRATQGQGVTEQDVRATVEQGAEAGVVDRTEHAIIENAFRLGDRQVGSLMTPRPDVRWVDVESSAADLVRRHPFATGVPLVVCEGAVDRVLGVAHAEQLLSRCLAGEPFDLRAALQPAVFVPTTMPAFQLLEQFRSSREHAALALDEYGGVQGIVTLDDILEALVGELPDPGDPAEPEIVRHQDGSWIVDAGTALEDLEHALDLDPLPAAERIGFRSVGGLIMARLGSVPTVGESVVVDGLRFEVIRMEGRRIATVRVSGPNDRRHAGRPAAADG